MEISEPTFQKFKAMIRRVTESPRSDFYREKFAREGFNPAELREIRDIVKIPWLTREELAATSPFDRLYSDPRDILTLRYTSGTSGSPLLFSFRGKTRYDFAGKRPLILGPSRQLDVYYALVPRHNLDGFPPLIGHDTDYRITAELARSYRIDSIIGSPSRITLLARELPDSVKSAIGEIFMTGERYTRDQASMLRSHFPNARLNPEYGMSEFGCPGYQCNELGKSDPVRYHVAPDYLLEIIDPGTGMWEKEDEEGEIVITELYESPHQIIRYRTGDAGRVVDTKPCTCGAPFSFEITGRIAHDIIRVAGGVLRTDEIERVIGELSGKVQSDFRGTVEFQGEKPLFRLRLIPNSGELHHPALLAALREEIATRLFLTPSKTLADFLKEERFADFILELVPEFPREAKVQRLRLIP